MRHHNCYFDGGEIQAASKRGLAQDASARMNVALVKWDYFRTRSAEDTGHSDTELSILIKMNDENHQARVVANPVCDL